LVTIFQDVMGCPASFTADSWKQRKMPPQFSILSSLQLLSMQRYNMRKTWDFFELGQTSRRWAEVLVILFILSVGFFSIQLLLNRAELPPCGTGQSTDHCAPQPHPASEMRWDQTFFTQFGSPCPAVYDAPNGKLRECM
jgi:hypothetical protein